MSDPLDEREFTQAADPLADVYLLGPRSAPALRVILQRVHHALVVVNGRIARAAQLLHVLDERLDATIRLTVVATADDLPTSAPPRDWYRVQGDPDIYIGNGPGRPLTRLVADTPPV